VPADRAVITRLPKQVQVWFSEGLEPRFSTIAVYNQSGQQVDLGDGRLDERNSAKLIASLPDDLPPGAYLVRMRPVFTSDGHAVNDTLVFWVGEQIGNIEALRATDRPNMGEAAWRTALTLALTLLFATYFSYAFLLRPAWGNPKWRLGGLPPRVMRRLSLLVWSSLLVAFGVNFLALLQISATLFQASLSVVLRDELWNIVLQGTNFGDVWSYRMGLLGALLFLQVIAAQQAKRRPQSTHNLWLLNLGLSALALATLTLISHAAGTSILPALALLASYLHLLGVALWVGGLVVVALVLRPALMPLAPQERTQALFALLRRFSPFALASVSLIVVTGIYSSLTQVPAPRDLAESTYGLTLLAKWILVLPLFALGAAHYRLLSGRKLPLIEGFITRLSTYQGLWRTLRLEVGLSFGVLFVATWLPATPPPAPESARAGLNVQSQSLEVEGYTVKVALSPSAVGANAVDVEVTQNGAAATLEQVFLRLVLPAYGRYTAPLALEEETQGVWLGALPDVNRAGEWVAMVDMYPLAAPPVRAALPFKVTREVQDEGLRSATPLHFLSALSIMGVLAAWAVPATQRYTRRLEWSPEIALVTVLGLALTISVTVGGAWLFAEAGREVEEGREQAPSLLNPLFPDQSALQAGSALYATQCLACHGPQGAGGLGFSSLLSRPVPDLRDSLVERQDQDLYRLLENGIVNRHLYGHQLSALERWQIVSFLRQLENR
jgi:copper transport protein